MKKPHKQTVVAAVLFLVFLVVAAGLAAALAVVFAPVKTELKDDSYTLTFLFHKENTTYSEVDEVLLLDEAYSAKKIKSYGGISKEFGTYQNDDYGTHFRLTYAENKKNFILIKKKDGSVTVFNQKSYVKTEELYKAFIEKLSEQ